MLRNECSQVDHYVMVMINFGKNKKKRFPV